MTHTRIVTHFGQRFFRWTLQVEVSETWVEDGFNLTDDRAASIFLRELGYATSGEVLAKVLTAPDPVEIRRTQGETVPPAPEGIRLPLTMKTAALFGDRIVAVEPPSPIEHAVTSALGHAPPIHHMVLRRGNAETQAEGFVTVELSRDDAGIRAVTIGDDSSPAGVEVELTAHELRQAERVLGGVSLKGGEP